MIKHFLNLEWKQYFRSSYWQKNILINILLVFLALYCVAMFLLMGVAMYTLLKKFFPEQDPFIVFNGFLFYWILGDLFVRFFFQKLPVMSVKPLLTLPIKRKTVVNFVLGKSALSFFNFLPLFAIVPFGIMLISEGYETSTILIWMFLIVIITLINNFLNFIIESLYSETELSFLPIILLVGGLYGLNHFGIISFTELVSSAIQGVVASPIMILIPIAIRIVLYVYNFKILKEKLFLDSSLKAKTQEASTTNLE